MEAAIGNLCWQVLGQLRSNLRRDPSAAETVFPPPAREVFQHVIGDPSGATYWRAWLAAPRSGDLAVTLFSVHRYEDPGALLRDLYELRLESGERVRTWAACWGELMQAVQGAAADVRTFIAEARAAGVCAVTGDVELEALARWALSDPIRSDRELLVPASLRTLLASQASSAPIEHDPPQRARGPKPAVGERVRAEMLEIGQEAVEEMKEEAQAAKFGASRDTCRRARKALGWA
jgi:hypothetical protein